jgi:hypothetical protein
MKTTGKILTLTTALFLVLTITFAIIGDYRYEKEVKSYWNLSDKASTIEKKRESIDKFVISLENSGLQGTHNALWMTTPDNSFDENFNALLTLQQRMHEISGMDVASFEYQTAMQQITGQEQGEAEMMLRIFKGCWYKDNYIMLWNWIGITQITLSILLLTAGLMLWTGVFED